MFAALVIASEGQHAGLIALYGPFVSRDKAERYLVLHRVHSDYGLVVPLQDSGDTLDQR